MRAFMVEPWFLLDRLFRQHRPLEVRQPHRPLQVRSAMGRPGRGKAGSWGQHRMEEEVPSTVPLFTASASQVNAGTLRERERGGDDQETAEQRRVIHRAATSSTAGGGGARREGARFPPDNPRVGRPLGGAQPPARGVRGRFLDPEFIACCVCMSFDSHTAFAL